jgi:ubiquitin conjugation factor E4 B
MASLIIDDMTCLLDDLFSKLAQIHALEAEIAASSWSTRPQAERVEREKTLHDLEQSASGYCERGMNTTALFRLSTTEPAGGAQFVTPELAPRLAAMLNYNLDALVGPRCVDLRVANNKKYRWDPRALLKEILRIFLNFVDKDVFVRAVAKDRRSYRRELFARAVDISRRRGIGLGEGELARLGKFADEVEAMKLVIDTDEDMG